MELELFGVRIIRKLGIVGVISNLFDGVIKYSKLMEYLESELYSIIRKCMNMCFLHGTEQKKRDDRKGEKLLLTNHHLHRRFPWGISFKPRLTRTFFATNLLYVTRNKILLRNFMKLHRS